jgi:hypothetical protein
MSITVGGRVTVGPPTPQFVTPPDDGPVIVVPVGGPQGEPGAPGTPGTPGAPGPSDTSALLQHIDDESPHPAYDENGPTFTLLYENAKV